ncbi:hypothetical protein B9479_005633 [Cryptococcus floricola]|uniref:Peptidase A1 domain-containing protein n=1 Tax=Cryptococcus floricola TaxID=2591691 RepID=A0A5D3AV91_9TREE|nr:hypothetical protein B9479_005633 [Cryptococcus floricola]
MISPSPLPLLSLFLILAAFASAAPIEPEPLHKLVLRKIPTARDGEHPLEVFERHQEAAIKRMHYFKRMAPPDKEFFRKRHMERRQMIEDNPNLDKRMWIPAVSPDEVKANNQKRTYWPDGGWTPGNTSTPLGNAAKELRKGAATQAAAAAAATATISASGSNDEGFSQAAVDALNDNTLTNSSSTLITGGLDYVIESNDIGYLADITLGTPAKTFLMLMDTGSADTWVPSTECGQANCGAHQALGSDSSTFQASNTAFQVTYGSGDVAGQLAADTMTIAGMTLVNHAMGVTTQESVQFSGANVPFDGLMGLALSTLSNQGVSTPIESLKSTGVLQNTVLGIALGRVNDGDNNGELVFGQADDAKIDAATTQTLKLTSTDGFWQVAMSAVSVDGQSAVTGKQAILDTGTSLMVAPEADATAVHQQIDGAADVGGGMFSIPCTTNQAVSMTFGNVAFNIDARDMIFQPLTNDLTGDCLSSLSAGTIKDDDTWLLGDTFLKNVYMTTNADDGTVQLSARTDTPGSSSADTAAVSAGTSGNGTTNNAAGTSGSKSASSSATRAAQTAAAAASTGSLLGALAALIAGGGSTL